MKPYRKPSIASRIRESSKLMPIIGTPYKLAVPHHLTHSGFAFGGILFDVVGYTKLKPRTPLPASWCVDLNA